MSKRYVIGIDYGSDSARAVIVDAGNGAEVASSVAYYPRWKKGLYCDPHKNRYRQHPLDYLEVLEQIVKNSLSQVSPEVVRNIAGLSFDTTGSTPALIDRNGDPLALDSEFTENPNAMFILWKDHTAIREAGEINALARKWHTDHTKYVGGIYSSEWVWAKMLHVLREDETIRDKAYAWIEHCDWMPAVLTGNTAPEKIVRSRCAAGHKALWHTDWDGLPPEQFLTALDPLLAGFREHLFTETHTSDRVVGTITPEWAEKLGLPRDVVVGVGAFDCHMGAVGAEITPNVLVRAIGTSTCDILVTKYADLQGKVVAGICGQVDGSVMAGYVGLEAGQSGFGDIFAWFKNVLAWPVKTLLPEHTDVLDLVIPRLSEEAEAIPIEESSLLATDWMNGRRTPDANQGVKGTVTGLTLASSAPQIFRALVEATAYGSRAIVEQFRREGIAINEVIGIGGVAKKSPFVMQVMADVLNMPIRVARTEQTCAAGAAMFAAVAAGIYPTVEEAQAAMGQGFDREYLPDPVRSAKYDELYRKYLLLGEFTEQNL